MKNFFYNFCVIVIVVVIVRLLYLLAMKNLRLSKKNPSKILKILQVPQTYRYSNNHQNTAYNSHIQELALSTSKEKQSKIMNISTQRDNIPRSPSRSQRLILIKSMEKPNKFRSKSLNRSDQEQKSQHKESLKHVMKHSIELKSRHDLSPYIKRAKLRESQKFLNFHSVNLGHRHRSERESKEMLNESSRKRYHIQKSESSQISDNEKKAEQQVIDNAKKLLNNGQYRKSLLMLKSIIKSKPDHSEALYLSAVNWFHLEDRSKVHYFTDQILQTNPYYSPQCYKLKAVCYFKTLQYSKSLSLLQQCHQCFPNEPESYDLEGRILIKMKKWKEALFCYMKSYQFQQNVDFLGIIGICYEELDDLDNALKYYSQIFKQKKNASKFLLKMMKIYIKKEEYQTVVDLLNQIADFQQNLVRCKEKQEIYYLFAYSCYKLKRYSKALVLIDEGLRCCQQQFFNTEFNKLLLMIKINERDIYEAFHLLERIEDEPQLRVLRRFVQGIINLMRRNYNEAITILLSIQNQLGYTLDVNSRFSNTSSEEGRKIQHSQVTDQFFKEISKIYLMFLSYAYFSISEFHSAKRFIELQKEIGVPQYFQLGLSYNYEMCMGIIQHCDRRFKEAESHFVKAKAMYQNKLEPTFSLALNYLQLMVASRSDVQKLQFIEKAKGEFIICKKMVGKNTNNTAASIFYFSSLLHGYNEEWKEALISIDSSIERSQDHYWRYFYIRGMFLACIHSFREAINDLTIALNLSNSSKPECYLLRSKCLQIQGEGNEAFKDLQEYISLKPDDPEVHKYAGQLLFQNGAFQDSITAFGHQSIQMALQNYDIFLTQGKSYFLLGKFKQAIKSMDKSYILKESEEIQFDIKVFEILQILTDKKDPLMARQNLEKLFSDSPNFGKIFKMADYFTLRAACFLLEGSYLNSIQNFNLAIKQKSTELVVSEDDDESCLIQNKKDLQTFANQLTYNIVLCYINLSDLNKASEMVETIRIGIDQPYYADFVNFRKFVNREIQIFKKQQVFPNRNKLSNFISKIKVKIPNKKGSNLTQLQLKLCIPFPKVEPPEIFPEFDKTLLTRLSVLNVQRKPEAPWILRQNNSIKFTEKIQTFSRLQIQDSQNESFSTCQILSIDNSHIDRNSSRSKHMHTSELEIHISKRKLQKFIE